MMILKMAYHEVQYQMKPEKTSLIFWLHPLSVSTLSISTLSPFRKAIIMQHLMMKPILFSLTPCRESTSFSASNFSYSFIRQYIYSEKLSSSYRFMCLPLFQIMWLQRLRRDYLMAEFYEERRYYRRQLSRESLKVESSLSVKRQKLKRNGLEGFSCQFLGQDQRESWTFILQMQNFLQTKKISYYQHSDYQQISLNSFTQAGRRFSSSRWSSIFSRTSLRSLKLRSILLLIIRQTSSSGYLEWNCLTLRMTRLLRARAFILNTLDQFVESEVMFPAIFLGDSFVLFFYTSLCLQMEQIALLLLARMFLIDFNLSEIFFLDFCRSSCEKMLVVFLSAEPSIFLFTSSSGHCAGSYVGWLAALELGSVGTVETFLIKYLAQFRALLDFKRFSSSRSVLSLIGTTFQVRLDSILVFSSRFLLDLKQFFLVKCRYSSFRCPSCPCPEAIVYLSIEGECQDSSHFRAGVLSQPFSTFSSR